MLRDIITKGKRLATQLILGNAFYWKHRKIDWEKAYWETKDHPHRDQLIRILEKMEFKSILEVGCNCGPNLKRLKEASKRIRMAGIDINEGSIAFGRKMLPEASLGVGNATKLPFADKSFDVILSDATLIYLSPRKIKKAKKEFLRVTRKAIVLVEWHDCRGTAKGKRIRWAQWVRNYTALFERPAEVRKITDWGGKGWGRYGYILVIHL